MNHQASLYKVGLAVYTFEDLLSIGKAVTYLVTLLQRLFPVFHSSILEAAVTSQQEQETAVEMLRVSWDELGPEIEAGKISRFQAQTVEDSAEARIVLRVALGRTRRRPERPNYLWLWLPTQCFVTDMDQATEALLIFGKEAFGQLGGAYGYAGIGVTGRSGSVTNHSISRIMGSVPVVEFFDINIETNFRDHVKGGFWANFLSKRHVDVLGGLEMIEQATPCYKVERLSNGGVLLVLSLSPIPENTDREKSLYIALREFLAPITVSRMPSIPPSLEKTGNDFRKSYST